MPELPELLAAARVFDLAQPYFHGMPHHRTHPPFLFGLTKKHGEVMRPESVSSASDAMTLSGHTGTHIDALCHFSVEGRLFGGIEVADIQSYIDGIKVMGIDSVAPILRKGVLLDIAAGESLEALPETLEIKPEHLERAAERANVRVESGNVVLLRTGWGRFWTDPARMAGPDAPGPGEAGARWLSEKRIYAAGSDTISFEKLPSASMPVHAHLLADSGIHIIEALYLEELARAGVSTFTFIALPLKIRGGTASPIRPVAVVV